MGPVILILAIAGLIWFGVLLRQITDLPFNPLIVLAIIVLLSASVFGPEFFSIASGPIPISIDRALLGGLLLIFVSRMYLGQERIRAFNRTDVLVFALVIYMMISTFSHDWTFYEKLPISRLLFFYLLPVSLYLVVRNTTIGVKELRIIVVALVGFGFYLALTGVAEINGMTGLIFPAYIADPLQQEFFGRARGPFMNPVSNGIVMTLTLACLVFMLPRSSPNVQKLIILSIPLFLLGIYGTKTRSVWLALILASSCLTVYLAPRQLRGGIVMCGVLAAMIMSLFLADSFSSFKRDKYVTEAEMKQSASLRPLFAIVAGRMFVDRPVMGHGFGQYRQAKMPYLQDPTNQYQLFLTKTYYQHNVFLAFVTELGLIGLGLLLMLLFDFTMKAIAIWRNRKRYLIARQFGLLMIVAIIGYCTNGMFHDVSIAPMNNMFMFFLAGITTNLATARSATEMSDEELAEKAKSSRKRTAQRPQITGTQVPAT